MSDMPITSMEELAVVEPGARIEVDDVGYWRSEPGWFATREGGPNALREKFFEGYITAGVVLGPGEILFKRGLIYHQEGKTWGVVTNPTDGETVEVVRFTADGTGYHPEQQPAKKSDVRKRLAEMEQPASEITEIILFLNEKVQELQAQLTEAGDRVRAAINRAQRAEGAISEFQSAFKAFRKFAPMVGAVEIPDDGGTGLAVDDSLRNRDDFDGLPVGTVVRHAGGNEYTKKEGGWVRSAAAGTPVSTRRTYSSGDFSVPTRYKVKSLPMKMVETTLPTVHQPTGLKVGSIIQNENQFQLLPNGTVVEFPADTPTTRYLKFDNGLWGLYADSVGRSQALASRRNRIVEMPGYEDTGYRESSR